MQANIFFKCLADETRLRCVALLHKNEQLCVCELTEALNLSQPKISRHLAYLRQTGLLIDSRVGQWVYYRINPDTADWVAPLIAQAVVAAEETGLMDSDYARLERIQRKVEEIQCC